MKKPFLILTTLLISAFVFSACGKQSKTPTQDSQIDDKITQPAATGTGSKTGSAADQLQAIEDSMKTLEDFQPIKATQATLTTTKGDVTFTLFREAAPLTTLNFLTLAKQGFYDDVVFHRVIEDFMAQVGDPLSKDESKKAMWGTGGPGYAIEDEFGEGLKHNKAGIVSMANSGPNSGGSQFFITYEPTPWLDGKHAIFGEVTDGMEVLEQIEIGDKIISVSYQ